MPWPRSRGRDDGPLPETGPGAGAGAGAVGMSAGSTLAATPCRPGASLPEAMDDDPPFLPFALPEIGEPEIAEVVDTLRSGWLTTGPKTRRVEPDVTAFLGDSSLQSLAVNSATAGLHL